MIEGIEQTDFGAWVIKGDTHISAWVKEHRSLNCDPYLFKWLEPRIKDAKVVWDVGANIGDHTRVYLDWGKDVVAFEPNYFPFQCLYLNCSDAECLMIGLSDERAKLQFVASGNVGASFVGNGGTAEINVDVADDMDLPAPDFIKLDIEGYEMKALIGMEKTLRENMPMLFIEINQGALARNNATKEQIKDFLRDIGYTSFTPYPEGVSEDAEQYDLFVQ